MTAPTRAFCRDASLAAGEPLAGTGGHPARMLLIRWPKRRWTRSIFAANDMSADEAAAIDALRGTGLRVQLIDRKVEAEGHHRLWLFPERLTREVPRGDLAAALRALARSEREGWEEAHGRLLLVCTHGRKDRCCARWGFAAYGALSREAAASVAPDGDGVEVWESTHLGGCRLAATTLGLPAMTKHGRVVAVDAAPLLQSERQGRPLARLWRGPTDADPERQAAAVAVAGWAAGQGGVAEALKGGEGRWSAPVRLPEGGTVVDVALARGSVRRPGTCVDLDAGTADDAPVWRPRSVSPRGT